MSTRSLRPSFRLPLSHPPDEAIGSLESFLDRTDQPIQSQRAGRHMTLTVTPAVRHFWSPWLNLEFENAERAEDAADTAIHTSVHARFSPAPSLWTGFMAVYFSLATAGFFAAMWALAQWTMGNRPLALWVVLACVLGCGGLWWVSMIGQRLAREQMHLLQDALENALVSPADPPAQS
ncbi:hypothetical protein [Algisphaera agarilytica]|uniref:Uncharacterized protein n=1 Tax=Algisphaera agarilytica TaxID=1385975 RepID=A0A7X0LK68_9BACT|nr:hypothetical protein [Algisphaera agarilytica]MBB6428643.1 hypothetical protein [Algisphaera agarilytica]